MAATNGNGIGTLREKSLHADLKNWYHEELVDGFHIDIKRDGLLIEIQTKNFSAMKKKLGKLLSKHPVLLVHPIASQKWIIKRNLKGKLIGKRKSPKKGRAEDIFLELIRIPDLVNHPNLSFDILLVDVEEIWLDDGKGSWRRGKWSIADRKLVKVNSMLHLEKYEEFLQFLPRDLKTPFLIKDLARALKVPDNLARKICYSLRKMGLLEIVGKEGNAHILNIVARVRADRI
jgi:hypothetical protein